MMTTALTAAATVVLIEIAARLHIQHSAKTTADATQAPAATRHAVPPLPRRLYPATPEPEHPVTRPYLVPPLQTAGAPSGPPTTGAPAPSGARHAAPTDLWVSPSWPPLTVDDTQVTKTVT
jgi:hypothetical protein